jgi:protein AroM
MSATIGLLTIGQAPRPDGLAHDVGAVVGDVRVIERGALDGMSSGEVAALAPGPDDYRLVTLLASGAKVEIAKRGILPRLQAQIDALEEAGADATLLMCTGEFPAFRHWKPLIAPQAALYATVIALAAGGRVGSVTPLASQVEQARRKWSSLGVGDAVVVDADPYEGDPVANVTRAAERLRDEGASVCFLDCFGYDLTMKRAARAAFGGTVVLARSLAGRLAAEVAA